MLENGINVTDMLGDGRRFESAVFDFGDEGVAKETVLLHVEITENIGNDIDGGLVLGFGAK